MAAKAKTTTAAIDGNVELEAAVKRYRQLAAWMEQAESEMSEIKDKAGVYISEKGVDALTLDNAVVARAVAYEKDSVDTKAFKAAHPRIFSKFAKKIRVAYTKIS